MDKEFFSTSENKKIISTWYNVENEKFMTYDEYRANKTQPLRVVICNPKEKNALQLKLDLFDIAKDDGIENDLEVVFTVFKENILQAFQFVDKNFSEKDLNGYEIGLR